MSVFDIAVIILQEYRAVKVGLFSSSDIPA